MNDVKRIFLKARPRAATPTAKDLKLSSFYNPSAIDSFLHYEHKAPFARRKSIRMTSDIYMLFNQQRLDRMTQTALIDHFNSMAATSPSLSALKSRLTDNQLLALVKSRYVQSPSELLNWSRYLNTLADSELQKIVQAAQQQQQQQQQQNGPAPQPSPAPQSSPAGE